MDVTIIDAGIGNIRSVQRMLEYVEATAEIVSNPSALREASRVILPGVGAFDAGMRSLEDGGWVEPLTAAKDRGVPVLGICLGMQLLSRRSEEGSKTGLGWIDADVTRIDTGGDPRLKIPHMGWAVTRPMGNNALITDEEEQRFYYVHSYRVVCDRDEDVMATATYGSEFTSGVHRGNVYGVQFHPEKSHRFGMRLMRRFSQVPC
jgi:glutamine amidotransferase